MRASKLAVASLYRLKDAILDASGGVIRVSHAHYSKNVQLRGGLWSYKSLAMLPCGLTGCHRACPGVFNL